MSVTAQIEQYIAAQTATKRSDMQTLHELIQRLFPGGKLWFLDGKNSEGKIVSNPNIGYGSLDMKYADGSSREFYQIGMSANTTGISIYIMGISENTYLAQTYGQQLGKASISGYCIKFKRLADIDIQVLEAALRDGISRERF